MIRPRALRPGDRIAIVAPASNCSREEFDRGIDEVRRLGFEPVFSDAVFERGVFSAGSPETRATDFLRAWTDPSVSALLAVRGGYGSVQILPHLPVAVIQQTPKLFIGYSDNTTILSWLNVQCGLTALHGPMLEGRLARGPEGYHVESFLALLQGSLLTPASGGAGLELMPGGVSALRHGEVSGPLFGGTLTQLVASLGTPYAFAPPAGSILFLEDVNERPYRLDRMLTQLDLAGVLERASALVFGEMRGCDEPGGQITARDTIAEATRRFDGPILYGFPSGHTQGPCWTVPLGVTVRVVAHDRGGIIVEEAPVV